MNRSPRSYDQKGSGDGEECWRSNHLFPEAFLAKDSLIRQMPSRLCGSSVPFVCDVDLLVNLYAEGNTLSRMI